MTPLNVTLIFLFTLVLSACGGGGSPLNDSTKSSDPSDPSDSGGPSESSGSSELSNSGKNITFLPLSILETSAEYSGLDKDDIYVTERFFPFIDGILLSTYDAKTRDSVTGTIDDFLITENGKVVDPLESFPMLQTVGAIPTFLHTAIVIDISGSVKDTHSNNYDLLTKVVSEARLIIAQAKNSSDSVIANQRFTIWAFGGQVEELTPNGFTDDLTVLNTALDRVLTETLYSSSNLNRAIVEAIGRFQGESGGDSYNFLDNGQLGNTNNDLIEGVSSNRIQLSSLILITSGTDTTNAFSDEEVKIALESQSQVKFKTDQTSDSDSTADNSVTENYGKPFIAVLVGKDESIQSSITDNTDAKNILNRRNQDSDTLSFATDVFELQQDLINQRKREGVLYLLRYASPLRQGSNERVISTSAVDTQYSLTTTKDFDSEVNVGMPSDTYIEGVFSSVEITADNDRYLQKFINISDTNVFYPATRWTNAVFANSDYAWQLDGNTLTANATSGAVTVNASDLDASGVSTLTLTNLGIGQTTSIQLALNPQPLIQIFGGSSNRPLTGKTISVEDIDYINLNAVAVADPADPVDPVDPDVIVPEAEFVYQIFFQDFNVPMESYSYTYSLSPDNWLSFKDAASGTLFDYKVSGNMIQIQKRAIDRLTAPITITFNNMTLSTTASFTIDPNP